MARMGNDIPRYMCLLDHDMLPHPAIMSHSVNCLQKDDNKAFIQYPQRFYDITGVDLLYAGNEIFFDGVQANRSKAGLTAFAGTNAVWNLQALYHVGGFQYGSLTEDASTGLAVHITGYTSTYSSRELAVGQSPQTVKDAMQQRMRWSQGAIEIGMNHAKAILCRRSAIMDVELPKQLAEEFPATRPKKPSFRKTLEMAIIYFDAMIYPFYSMGYLLHVAVCLSLIHI